METIAADDPHLYERFKAVVDARGAVCISAAGAYKALDALRRMLGSFSGQTDTRTAWRSFRDALPTGEVFACWGLAVNDRGYGWRYEDGPDKVVIVFVPPER
jgi:hypothetical protein